MAVRTSLIDARRAFTGSATYRKWHSVFRLERSCTVSLSGHASRLSTRPFLPSFSQIKKAARRRPWSFPRFRLVSAFQRLDGLDHRHHNLLRIAVDEIGVVGEEQL